MRAAWVFVVLYAILVLACCRAAGFTVPSADVCYIRGVKITGMLVADVGTFKTGGTSGPYGTCWLFSKRKFYGPGGNVVPAEYFNVKGKIGSFTWKFSPKKKFVHKLIPKGFYWFEDSLVSRNGLWYFSGLGNVYFMGDMKSPVPQSFLRWNTATGGFFLLPEARDGLNPPGFKLRYEGLYSPTGVLFKWLRKDLRYEVVLPSGNFAPAAAVEWVNRGFFIKRTYRVISGKVHRVLPGPLATYHFRKAFYGAGGSKLPARYFYWKGKTYHVKKNSVGKLYPKGFTAGDGFLVGPHGVYYYAHRGVFKTLGDTGRYVPSSYFVWRPDGGFNVRRKHLNKLYPVGFTYKGNGLYSPLGLVSFYNRAKDSLAFFNPDGSAFSDKLIYWHNGGFYPRTDVRVVGKKLVRVFPGVWGTYYYSGVYYNMAGHVAPAKYFVWIKKRLNVKNIFKWGLVPRGYFWYNGLVSKSLGIYFHPATLQFISVGDQNGVLPSEWFVWHRNGGFYVRKMFKWQLWPKGFWWKNFALHSSQGIVYKWDPKKNVETFHTKNGRRIPNFFFFFENRVFVVQPKFANAVRKMLK